MACTLRGATSEKELLQIGRAFKGVPLAVSVLERGGATPWLPPADLYKLGFTMILYPASVLFRVTRAIEMALKDLLAGEQLTDSNSVSMKEFGELLNIDHWRAIEKTYEGGPLWEKN